MLIKAAEAIASVVTDEQLNPNYIIPSVFHPDMSKTVAKAIVDCVPKVSSAER
jgi:malate dehydrogenase (oxaloacetate-decarboxylating)